MELATPISIYWDLPAEADSSSLLRICRDIQACRPLMLQLTASAPGLGCGTMAVLEQFKGGATAVSLTLPAAAFDAAPAASLVGLGLKEILLTPDSVELPAGAMALARSADQGACAALPALGVSFQVTRENWQYLPQFVASCRQHGISRLVLPMQRLYGGEKPFLLTRKEQQLLAGALAASGGAEGINLTIHDPFLWRAFNPGVPFPQGGCQAANTMLAIAPGGCVYPCPALPMPLGAIGEISLKEIVASANKKELRHRLLEVPEACRACQDFAGCCGGCRGRSYVTLGTLESPDPACA